MALVDNSSFFWISALSFIVILHKWSFIIRKDCKFFLHGREDGKKKDKCWIEKVKNDYECIESEEENNKKFGYVDNFDYDLY